MLSNDEIRLLILHPTPANTSSTTPIQCDIEIVALSDKPEYEALSYVWGSESAPASIQLANRTVPVSPTVHDALLRLRLPDQNRALWVDQLCINQQDLDEKMRQVRLMRDIYTLCSQCIVWMGEIRKDLRLEDAEAVFQFFHYMAEVERVGHGNAVLPATVRDNMAGMTEAMKSLAYAGNPWWERIWTVQEAALPQSVAFQWGPLSLPWDVLDDGYSMWAKGDCHNIMSERQAFIVGEIMIHYAWLYNARFQRSDLWVLIQTWRFRFATDPRDKIYGLLGLCDAGRLPQTELCDYNHSAPRVFSTLTRELILDMKELKPLIPYPRPDVANLTPNMPSWAMDLQSNRCSDVPTLWFQMPFYDIYRADEGLGQVNLEMIQSEPRYEVLRLEGFRIDKVAHVEKGYRKELDDEVIYETTEPLLRPWYDVAMRESTDDSSQAQTCDDIATSPYLNFGYNRREAFLKLVLGDFIRGRDRELVDDDLKAAWDLLNLELTHVDGDIRYTAYNMMVNQSMFITRNGLMGLGNRDVRAGDEVWIFKGGKVPFTIRPLDTDEEGGGYYSHGHCYVQGIMKGEVAKGYVPGLDLVERTVCLR